ncbi:hypothetical protein F7725_017735 [Dissostichus mawsoni]|uniref:Uncharacterized protein n=1 Tax=Dissostichus mawsoni TaxID=36200 RepID=A0A7J5XSE8_DISMA|nr:hypothetical protein F7725_017735 [Dissostichus mawsoni]
MNPVTRCSLMPRNLGCSPGAAQPDSSFRLLTCEMESTVAATNHGRPMMEQTPSITATMNRSSLFSFLLTMTAVICWSMKMRIVQSSAGTAAASSVHHGFVPRGEISQPRELDVGLEKKENRGP